MLAKAVAGKGDEQTGTQALGFCTENPLQEDLWANDDDIKFYKSTTWGNNLYQSRSGVHYPTVITARMRVVHPVPNGVRSFSPLLPLSVLARIDRGSCRRQVTFGSRGLGCQLETDASGRSFHFYTTKGRNLSSQGRGWSWLLRLFLVLWRPRRQVPPLTHLMRTCRKGLPSNELTGRKIRLVHLTCGPGGCSSLSSCCSGVEGVCQQ